MIASWLDPGAGTRRRRPALGSLMARRPSGQRAGAGRRRACRGF
ncbi:MAG: hypothetical protein WCP70_05735 [Methanothrix sp.]